MGSGLGQIGEDANETINSGNEVQHVILPRSPLNIASVGQRAMTEVKAYL